MEAAFREDAPGRDDDSSLTSYEDSSGPAVKGSMSGQGIDFDPEPEQRFKVPKSKQPKKLIRIHGCHLRWILRYLDDPVQMREFIKQNIETLCWADEIRKNFMEVLKRFAPHGTKFNENMEPETLLNILKDVLENYQMRVAMLDLSLDRYNLLEGTALKFKIEDYKKKVGDLLETYQARMNEAEDNLYMLLSILKEDNTDKTNIIHYFEAKVDQLYNALLCLQGRTSDQPVPTQEEFFGELKEHLEQDIRLNSSLLNSNALKEELAEEKRKKHVLFREICSLQEDRILEEEQKMKDVAELARDFQLEDGLKKEIVGRIKTLAVIPDEVHYAVEDWMETIRSSISNKGGEIERLKKVLKDMEDEITELKAVINEKYEEKHKGESVILEMNQELDQLWEIFNSKQQQLKDLDNGIDELDSKIESHGPSPTRYYDARSTLDSMRQSHSSSPTRYYEARSTLSESPEFYGEGSRSKYGASQFPPKTRHYTPNSAMFTPQMKDLSSGSAKVDASGSYSLSDDESPEKRRQGSPYRGGTYFDDSNLTSIDSTPRSASPQYSVTPPSPFHIPSPLMGGIPSTITLPGPSSKFAPRTSTVHSTTQNKVSNRFDIGKSFNLRTTCDTSTPYKQVTRVASFMPESGYSGRMMEHPLSITHSGEITPTQYETPFISQSRFGYTDPTARILNMPPDLETFKQVTPSQQEQGISPDVVTYGTPPAVTPTTTRRHGLFTPKGIFRKKHFNVRRIFDPEYFDSPELSVSPQYIPADLQSPARPSTFSPSYSDKSISWEEQYSYPYNENIMSETFQAPPAMNRTFDATTSPTINRTFVASPPYGMNRTFVASPPYSMNRKFVASPPYGMNRTFDASSPYSMNRTFDASSPYGMNRTFDASPPYVMNRTFDASPPYGMNRTLDRYPASGMDRTFDGSSPYAMDRTFDRSPALVMDRTFDACAQPHINRTFVAASPCALNKTFDVSASHPINRTFNKSLSSPLGRTFQQSLSPASPLNAMNRTFDRSPMSAMNRTFDASSPQMNRTFNKSLSSPLGRTFHQSPSPASSPYAMNRTFDAFSPQLMSRTFDASSPNAMNRTFDAPFPHASSTYTMNRTFDASTPPPMNTTFNTPSPYALNTTFGGSPPYQMNRIFNKSLLSPFGRSPSPNLNRISPRNVNCCRVS